jgi:heme/copper-type cytochrome/quinol oxidase subunit 4
MKAIAQLVLQLYEAYMRMKPDDDTSEWAMYGMVTTAVEAVFVKALSFVRGM